jgi:hypothetical protein
MVDFPKFLTTAAELYGLWPSLFNWLGGIAGTILTGAVVAAWWMRGYKASADIAKVETEKASLKGQIDVLQQRLALATEQQRAAAEQATKFESELSAIKAKAATGDTAKDIQSLTTNLEITLQKLLLANNTVTSTLTFPGAGYFDKPKPK